MMRGGGASAQQAVQQAAGGAAVSAPPAAARTGTVPAYSCSIADSFATTPSTPSTSSAPRASLASSAPPGPCRPASASSAFPVAPAPSRPAASSQPSSRSLTVGTYRGNNALYAYAVPVSAFVAGTNTMTLAVISGSGGTGYLSPGYSYDCVEMY
jgi:hypothetical protein